MPTTQELRREINEVTQLLLKSVKLSLEGAPNLHPEMLDAVSSWLETSVVKESMAHDKNPDNPKRDAL